MTIKYFHAPSVFTNLSTLHPADLNAERVAKRGSGEETTG